jgi:hypothetical protein
MTRKSLIAATIVVAGNVFWLAVSLAIYAGIAWLILGMGKAHAQQYFPQQLAPQQQCPGGICPCIPQQPSAPIQQLGAPVMIEIRWFAIPGNDEQLALYYGPRHVGNLMIRLGHFRFRRGDGWSEPTQPPVAPPASVQLGIGGRW